jgi:hypothetical protein
MSPRDVIELASPIDVLIGMQFFSFERASIIFTQGM